MTPSSSNPNPVNPIARCQHRNRAGRQCKLPARTGYPLCYSHNQARRKEDASAELAAAILGGRSQFASASDINHVLSQVLVAAVHKRLSAREATAFAYICSLLLRSVVALSQGKSPAADASSGESANPVWDQLDRVLSLSGEATGQPSSLANAACVRRSLQTQQAAQEIAVPGAQ